MQGVTLFYVLFKGRSEATVVDPILVKEKGKYIHVGY